MLMKDKYTLLPPADPVRAGRVLVVCSSHSMVVAVPP